VRPNKRLQLRAPVGVCGGPWLGGRTRQLRPVGARVNHGRS